MIVPPFTILAADERFGQLVRRRRRELKMTQQQLAFAVGVSTGAIQRWETSNVFPNKKDSRIYRLSVALAVPYKIIDQVITTSIESISYDKNESQQQHVEHLKLKELYQDSCPKCRLQLLSDTHNVPHKNYLLTAARSAAISSRKIPQPPVSN